MDEFKYYENEIIKYRKKLESLIKKIEECKRKKGEAKFLAFMYLGCTIFCLLLFLCALSINDFDAYYRIFLFLTIAGGVATGVETHIIKKTKSKIESDLAHQNVITEYIEGLQKKLVESNGQKLSSERTYNELTNTETFEQTIAEKRKEKSIPAASDNEYTNNNKVLLNVADEYAPIGYGHKSPYTKKRPGYRK